MLSSLFLAAPQLSIAVFCAPKNTSFFLFHRIINIIIIYVFCTVPSFVFAVFLFLFVFRLIVLRQRTVRHEFFFLVMVFLIHHCSFFFSGPRLPAIEMVTNLHSLFFLFLDFLLLLFFSMEGVEWGCTPMYESFIFICAFVSSTLRKGTSIGG